MLAQYRKTAAERIAALPARQKEELAQATKEGRQAYPIIPMVEVSPAVLGPCVEKMTQIPTELEETVGTLRRVCSKQPVPFAMRADQLLAVLDAAGVKDAHV